ncbi:MAG: polyphosphate kinase 1 [Bacteroidetes bacterium RIFCSPLOWO2_12_FULL_35_15]|nr:MAG: polyphosphate kinase 1 [Bacteroidetes bacterium RIFCSPLOWO2_12_FULL_35_15]
MAKKNIVLINRELSWLAFNERVLQEAADQTVPLIERIKFLGIYSNNLDEFFRVRVATLKRIIKHRKTAKVFISENPQRLLDKIQKIVIDQQNKFEKIYQSILKELTKNNISIINEKHLSAKQAAFVRDYFSEKVMPTLFPIMLDESSHFPYLKDRTGYLIVKLGRKNSFKKNKFALLEVPTDTISRFLVLPKENERNHIILLDDVIRFCLDDIFSNFDYDYAEAYNIKMTRDAEIDMDNDLSKSFVEKISKGLKARKKGQPVRLVYDHEIAPDILAFIIKKIKLRKEDNLIPGGRYHNFKDFISFPNIGGQELSYKKNVPLKHPDLKGQSSIIKVLKKRDVLLTYPYQSYEHIIDLLREASIDPKVQSIKITLYRVAKNSNVVKALINAVKNGKQVTAVVELQARFDEEANIYWSNKLQEEGATVIYGVPGLKVHSKMFLITRKESGKLIQYSNIGTGNFNGDTAKIYTDHSLLTSDKRITEEVAKVFTFYFDNFKKGTYKHLLVSPFYMRKRILQLINKEIQNARKNKPAYFILKLNNLVDPEMIQKIYDASAEGVKIKLIIRGICSLVAGIKGLSDNIEAISIVDKFLEHSRVFIFCNGGDEKFYISSGDWMPRNLDFRSEVAVPIYDTGIQQTIRKIIELLLEDNTKSRILGSNQNNEYRKSKSKTQVRAQESIYNLFKTKKN